jgi:hypothetical protein
LLTIHSLVSKGGVTNTKGDHTITHARVADQTASINLSLWDAQVRTPKYVFLNETIQPTMLQHNQGEMLSSGDIIKLTGGYTMLYKNSLVLYSGCMHGTLERVGQYNLLFKEHPNMSSMDWNNENGSNKPSVPSFPANQ